MNSAVNTDPKACKDIDAWVIEFFLQRHNNLRVSSKKLLSRVQIKEDYPGITKLTLLRDLWNDVVNGSVEERTLDQLELMEGLLLDESCIILGSLKSAYCWVAVDCTVRYVLAVDVKEGRFLDAMKRIWEERIGSLKERKSELVSRELIKWEDDLNRAVDDPDLCKRIREANTRYIALSFLGKCVLEQLALLESPSLETKAERLSQVMRSNREIRKRKKKKQKIREISHGGEDGVIHLDDDDDMGDTHNEQLPDNEAVINADQEKIGGENSNDAKLAEELKVCLSEMLELVNNPGLRASKANDIKKALNLSKDDPSTPQSGPSSINPVI